GASVPARPGPPAGRGHAGAGTDPRTPAVTGPGRAAAGVPGGGRSSWGRQGNLAALGNRAGAVDVASAGPAAARPAVLGGVTEPACRSATLRRSLSPGRRGKQFARVSQQGRWSPD